MDIKYMISADFGQSTDPTAVAVTERRLVPTDERYQHSIEDLDTGGDYFGIPRPVEQHYDLLRLDRVELRTPYTKIAKGLVTLLQEFYSEHVRTDPFPGARLTTRVHVGLAIDEGGVGKAVKDILNKEVEVRIERGKPHIHFLPVTAHGGAAVHRGTHFYHVPKRDLISAGIIAYQSGRLKVGRLRHRGVLEQELADYRLKQNALTGNESYGPFREGRHDDLVFATCLNVWAWEQATRKQKYLRFPNQIPTW